MPGLIVTLKVELLQEKQTHRAANQDIIIIFMNFWVAKLLEIMGSVEIQIHKQY